MTQLKPSPKHVRIGQRVHVLTGSCIGAVGVIANVEQGHTVRVRVRFDPPVRIPSAGLIGGVWRTEDGVEEVD
jgi:UDP-3-O-[3-hydroxymyristoyl] glucosamine N-acyltransferase